ncbi:rCG59797, partial [Rattus norvegicus]
MRRCLAAAAAPGEAPLELFSGISSALPERANGDASP